MSEKKKDELSKTFGNCLDIFSSRLESSLQDRLRPGSSSECEDDSEYEDSEEDEPESLSQDEDRTDSKNDDGFEDDYEYEDSEEDESDFSRLRKNRVEKQEQKQDKISEREVKSDKTDADVKVANSGVNSVFSFKIDTVQSANDNSEIRVIRVGLSGAVSEFMLEKCGKDVTYSFVCDGDYYCINVDGNTQISTEIKDSEKDEKTVSDKDASKDASLTSNPKQTAKTAAIAVAKAAFTKQNIERAAGVVLMFATYYLADTYII